MASNIDATQPPASNPTTAAMRANMAAAKAEIEALQALPQLIALVSCQMGSAVLTPSATWQGILLGATSEFESMPGIYHYDGDLLESWFDLAPAIAAGATHFSLTGSISVTTASLTGTRGIRAVTYTAAQTMGSHKTPPLLETGIQGLPYVTRKIPFSFITDTDKRLRFEVLQSSAASLTFGGDTPLSRMSIEFWRIP